MQSIKTVLVSSAVLCLLTCCSSTPQQRAKAHMDKGFAALKAKNLKRAIIEFKIASQNTPKDPEPIYQIGLAYLKKGDGILAISSFQRVLRIMPTHSGALYPLARLYGASSRKELIEDARDKLASIVKDHPDDAEALYALAAVYEKLGEEGKALQAFDSAMLWKPRDLASARLLISAQIQRRNYAGAETSLSKAIEHNPGSADAAMLAGETALASGNSTHAELYLQRAIELRPHFKAALNTLLRLYIVNRRFDEAESVAREIAALPDGDTKAVYAHTLLLTGKREAALAEFLRLEQKYPENISIRHQHARALKTVGNASASIAVLNDVIRRSPRDVEALTERATLFIDEDRLEDAKKDLETAIAIRPRTAEVNYQRSRLYAKYGQKIKQGNMLAEALQANPALIQARFELAELLTAAGKTNEALSLLDNAAEQSKSASQFISHRNAILIAENRWDEVQNSISAFLSKQQDSEYRDSNLITQEAMVRMHLNDSLTAARLLDEAIALDPNNATALASEATVFKARNDGAGYLQWLRLNAEKHPNAPVLQLFAGRIFGAAGDHGAARAAFQAARLAGKHSAADLELASLDISEGHLQSAKELLNASLKEKEDSTNRALLASVEERLGHTLEAQQNYIEAIRTAPGNWIALNNYANFLSNQPGRMSEAQDYMRKATAVEPANGLLQESAGWLCYRVGDYKRAIQYLQESAKQQQERASVHYHLAAAYFKGGNLVRARQEYDRALKADPGAPEKVTVGPLFASLR